MLIRESWGGEAGNNNRTTIKYGEYNYMGSPGHCKRHHFQLDEVKAVFPEGEASEPGSLGQLGLTRWRRGMHGCMEGENVMLAGKSKKFNKSNDNDNNNNKNRNTRANSSIAPTMCQTLF